MPERKTGNSEFYIQVLEILLQQIRRMRLKFWEDGTWFLLCDDSPTLSAMTVKCFLASQCGVQPLI